ncbi:MAG: sensor histidine kinase [Phycisphaeraceae bacterium]
MHIAGEHVVPDSLFGKVVDALGPHVAVVDATGLIMAVNRAWMRFAEENGPVDMARVGVGANYFKVCEADTEHRSAKRALRGIRSVLTGELNRFELDYPCHSPSRHRWYTMQVTSIQSDPPLLAIAHIDLTRRKLVERRLLKRLERLVEQMTKIEQDERRRLASQLHDHLQQLLVAARMALSSGTLQNLDPGIVHQINNARKYLDEAVTATRSLSSQIRPLALEETGLAQALRQLAAQHTQLYKIPVDLTLNPPEFDLPETHGVFLYHVVRELLLNAVKHASPTRHTVNVTCESSRITLTVADNGTGTDPQRLLSEHPESGTGLRAIRQRLRYLGGKMTVQSAPNQGTTITLAVPGRGIRCTSNKPQK